MTWNSVIGRVVRLERGGPITLASALLVWVCPAAIAHGADAIHAFSEGDDRDIRHNWWTSGKGWNGWTDDLGNGRFLF